MKLGIWNISSNGDAQWISVNSRVERCWLICGFWYYVGRNISAHRVYGTKLKASINLSKGLDYPDYPQFTRHEILEMHVPLEHYLSIAINSFRLTSLFGLPTKLSNFRNNSFHALSRTGVTTSCRRAASLAGWAWYRRFCSPEPSP